MYFIYYNVFILQTTTATTSCVEQQLIDLKREHANFYTAWRQNSVCRCYHTLIHECFSIELLSKDHVKETGDKSLLSII